LAGLSDDEFRTRLETMLGRSGRSMRGLSAALGRDPGYVAALLDPSRPSRARPTPVDLLAASDATGIPLVEWLAALWGVDLTRLADELTRLGITAARDHRLDRLPPSERSLIIELIDTLAERRKRRPRPQAEG
jgi:hypothetical protein